MWVLQIFIFQIVLAIQNLLQFCMNFKISAFLFLQKKFLGILLGIIWLSRFVWVLLPFLTILSFLMQEHDVLSIYLNHLQFILAFFLVTVYKSCRLPWWLSGKESADNAGNVGLIPGRSPGEGNGNPLQYYCLEILWTEEPGLQSLGRQKNP